MTVLTLADAERKGQQSRRSFPREDCTRDGNPSSPTVPKSWSPDVLATDPVSVGFTTHDSCLTQGGCQFESCQTSNDCLRRSGNTGYCRSVPGFHSRGLVRKFRRGPRKKSAEQDAGLRTADGMDGRDRSRSPVRNEMRWNESVQGRRLNSDGRIREDPATRINCWPRARVISFVGR